MAETPAEDVWTHCFRVEDSAKAARADLRQYAGVEGRLRRLLDPTAYQAAVTREQKSADALATAEAAVVRAGIARLCDQGVRQQGSDFER